MSGMDDLAAFLAARYDEAQATARAASMAKQDGEEWHADPDPEIWGPGAGTAVLRDDGGPLAMAIGSYAADHIAATDPAHRLADIKLKRAILAEHPHCRVDYSMTLRTDLDEPFGCSTCDWDRDYGQGGEGWCATVRQLGTEFSDHPDYKPGWRPDDTAAAAP